MTSEGTVREWLREEGWGILDSVDTPGGCWTHFSYLIMDGEHSLLPGERVLFTWEHVAVDGLPYRAKQVWPEGHTSSKQPEQQASGAYRSSLHIDFER